MLRLPALIAVLLLVSSFDVPKLVKVKVNDRVSIKIPKDFIPMDGLDFMQRYPSVRAPLAAYTNEAREVDFSVNTSATQWPDANVELAQRFFKSGIVNMFDKVEMISEGVREVNGKQLIYFEFESRVEGSREREGIRDPVLKYSYVQYWVEPGKTLVFSFNCPRRLRSQWQETARVLMQEIRIR